MKEKIKENNIDNNIEKEKWKWEVKVKVKVKVKVEKVVKIKVKGEKIVMWEWSYVLEPLEVKVKIEVPPTPHSQQNKIGVPPILELNKASFGNRRTVAHLDFPSESGCNISKAA